MTCDNIFVYGTLKQNRMKMLQFLVDGKIKGTLDKLWAYPRAFEDGQDYIDGEIYRINDQKVLEFLDKYEGYKPDKPEQSLFVRKITTAFLNDGSQIRVFVYFFNLR